MSTMLQQGSFGQQSRAYAKAPLGMRLNRINGMRQNACNRIFTVLYGHGIPRAQSGASAIDGTVFRWQGTVRELGRQACRIERLENGNSCADWADHFQLHEVSCTNRRPLASRILTAGLLPHLQLRCSLCQGAERLAQQQSNLHRLRCSLTTASCFDLEYKNVPLHGAAHLSHLICKFFSHPAIRTGCSA